MRGRRLRTTVAILLAVVTGTVVFGADRLAGARDDSADRLLAHTIVPSPAQRVGEVRVVQRGTVRVVQTLLSTKLLKRVVGEIRTKEESNWPEGASGSEDARRYVEALERAQQRIWNSLPKGDRNADRTQRLLIEFAHGGGVSAVFLDSFESGSIDGPIVPGRKPIEALELSDAYVSRNIRLIVADSFHVGVSDLGKIVPGWE